MLRCSRIAIALHKRFHTISVDAALTGVNVGIGAGPEVFSVSVDVVPPGINDFVQLERCVITVVLNRAQATN